MPEKRALNLRMRITRENSDPPILPMAALLAVLAMLIGPRTAAALTGAEGQLVRLALDILGPGEFIITSPEDASVAAIRRRFPAAAEVPVALTLRAGRLAPGPSGIGALRAPLSELRPWSRLRACGADWVAVNHRLALAGVARQCRRHHVKVMVWTVNNEREIRYWLSRRRADVLITDRPALAVAIRSAVSSAAGARGR